MRFLPESKASQDAYGMANSVDPSQTAPEIKLLLFWVFIVFPDLFVQKLWTITAPKLS